MYNQPFCLIGGSPHAQWLRSRRGDYLPPIEVGEPEEIDYSNPILFEITERTAPEIKFKPQEWVVINQVLGEVTYLRNKINAEKRQGLEPF